MNITQYSVASGRIIGEDGTVYNVVDLLGGGEPVGEAKLNITQYSVASGRVIGEDNRIYNLVELLGGIQKQAQVINGTEATATIEQNKVYEYGEVDELNITLSDDVGSYEVVFGSGDTPTVLSITSTKQLLWHNEPVVLANKVYVLAVEVGTTYARAVLSYAE